MSDSHRKKEHMIDRFERYFQKTKGCWLWEGDKIFGYGRFFWHGESFRAHRIAYWLYVDPIPDGLCVCHKCDQRGCVRPSHLFLGTYADNIHDMYAKDRASIGENHYKAKLTLAQVNLIRAEDKQVRASKLAAEFGVSKNTINDIRRGSSWKRTVAKQALEGK